MAEMLTTTVLFPAFIELITAHSIVGQLIILTARAVRAELDDVLVANLLAAAVIHVAFDVSARFPVGFEQITLKAIASRLLRDSVHLTSVRAPGVATRILFNATGAVIHQIKTLSAGAKDSGAAGNAIAIMLASAVVLLTMIDLSASLPIRSQLVSRVAYAV